LAAVLGGVANRAIVGADLMREHVVARAFELVEL
jgi:hypothetical protein